MRPILLLVSSLFLAGCGDGGDGAVLEQLRNAGADLSKARDVRYYLYVPTQDAATQVANELAAAGRTVDVSPAATGSDWLILVNEQVVVDATTLAARRSDFEAALDGVDGMYDGWEAAAEP
ncbi:MAG: ribonuclease E inhibitor RraB [Chloroflexota bacterium]|nr:ribonuclease E inhibitor RraB [Chloroflexota bacterium]